MNLVAALSILGCVGVIAAVLYALRKAAFPKENLPITSEWIDELSVERYRPMMRLLDGGDLEFISSQPGVNAKIIRGLRRQRCRIFRSYLRELNTDFACICMAIRMVLLQSQTDRPDLASTLVRSQCVFAVRMLAIQAQLFFYERGVGGVSIHSVLKLFDGLRLELRSLVPASASCGV